MAHIRTGDLNRLRFGGREFGPRDSRLPNSRQQAGGGRPANCFHVLEFLNPCVRVRHMLAELTAADFCVYPTRREPLARDLLLVHTRTGTLLFVKTMLNEP